MKNSSKKIKDVDFEAKEAEVVEVQEKDSLWQRAKKFANSHKVAFIGGATAIGLALLKLTNQRKIEEEVNEINEFESEEENQENQVSES